MATAPAATTPLALGSPTRAALAEGQMARPRCPPMHRCILTQEEMATRREAGLCFNCDEKFTPGHHYKRLFLLITLGDDKDAYEDNHDDDPTISLYTLMGIQPCTGRTMQMRVRLAGVTLMALLDTGSIHNFVSQEIVAREGISLQAHRDMQVTVVNGDRIGSSGLGHDLPLRWAMSSSRSTTTRSCSTSSILPLVSNGFRCWDPSYGTSPPRRWPSSTTAIRSSSTAWAANQLPPGHSPARVPSWRSYSTSSPTCLLNPPGCRPNGLATTTSTCCPRRCQWRCDRTITHSCSRTNWRNSVPRWRDKG